MTHMSEHDDFPVDDPVDDGGHDGVEDAGEAGAPTTGSVVTGHPAVDEVLRALEGLDGRPVDEHVAAFEQAHEVLRRALSSAGDDPASS